MNTAPDAVPVVHRWTAMTLTRLVIAGAAAAAVAGIPGLALGSTSTVLTSCALYAGLVVGTEALRRRSDRRGLWLMPALVVLDGLFLAAVVNATGGSLSPLNMLVYLHVVAMTLVVSFRAGLQAAIVHAALVVAPVAAMGSSLDPTMWAVPAGAALRATSYLLMAIAAAAYASIDERALRRGQVRLAGQVDLLSQLDETHDVDAAAQVIGEHVVATLGFTRAAVAVVEDGRTRVVVAERRAGGIDHVIAEVADARLPGLTELQEGRVVLLSSLADERWTVIDRLLSDAQDLVVAPMIAGDRRCGAIVAEWPGGSRHEIDLNVVDELVLAARFGGMALRSTFLLAEVEDRSRRDHLTGLGNRRYFQEALDREVARSQRADGDLSLVLLDLDHFKAVNDHQGHLAGDAVLEEVGRALTDAGRAYDIVTRIGGDEFAILLTGCGAEAAWTVAERARQKVWDVVGDRGVSACAGVATAPTDGCRPRDLVHRADQALYAAKAAGRNRVVIAPPSPEVVLDLADGRPPAIGVPDRAVEARRSA